MTKVKKIILPKVSEIRKLPQKELNKLWNESTIFCENVESEVYRRETVRLKKVDTELRKELK
jgi:hypothetical protein